MTVTELTLSGAATTLSRFVVVSSSAIVASTSVINHLYSGADGASDIDPKIASGGNAARLLVFCAPVIQFGILSLAFGAPASFATFLAALPVLTLLLAFGLDAFAPGYLDADTELSPWAIFSSRVTLLLNLLHVPLLVARRPLVDLEPTPDESGLNHRQKLAFIDHHRRARGEADSTRSQRHICAVALISVIIVALAAVAAVGSLPVTASGSIPGAAPITPTGRDGVRGALDDGHVPHVIPEQVAFVAPSFGGLQPPSSTPALGINFINAVASVTALLLIYYPAEAITVFIHAPICVLKLATFPVVLLLSILFPLGFLALNRRLGIMRRWLMGINHVRHHFPVVIGAGVLASQLRAVHSSGASGTQQSVSVSASWPNAGPPFDPSFVTASFAAPPLTGAGAISIPFIDEWVADSGALHHQSEISQMALLNASSVAAATANASNLPTIVVVPDTGATASAGHDCKTIINMRPCDEIFGSANGEIAKCVGIGDMPVIALDSNGTWRKITFTNVRCVPKFKHNLISVDQLWAEQNIDSFFSNKHHLKLPESAGGHEIPFSKATKLNSIMVVSLPLLEKQLGTRSAASSANSSTAAASGSQTALIGFHGFHGVGKTAHTDRLSTEAATALFHRRRHEGDAKTRKLFGVTQGAPKSLTSARAVACAFCAAAGIRKASHPGHMPTPDGPGVLHVDIKGPMVESLHGSFRYAAFFTCSYSRNVTVKYMKLKSEIVHMTKLAIADFEHNVANETDDEGKPIGPRPRIREIRSDHEGGLTSHNFEAFQAAHSIHSTKSPPHDHDTNGISESIIHVISTKAAAIKSFCNAPASVWPFLFSHAVDIHNSSPTSIGSSSADPAISPHQRHTHHQPKVSDIATFGCRAVVLKPPPHQTKGNLSERGWVGVYMGRSRSSVGASAIWLPTEKKIVYSSSVVIDEEYFPWRSENAYCPLTPAPIPTPAIDPNVLGGQPSSTTVPTAPMPSASMNDSPSRQSHALILFSGPYDRPDGLSDRLRSNGFTATTQVDSDDVTGGGWAHSIYNDEFYTQLKSLSAGGTYDAIMIAPPCSPWSFARFFPSPGGTNGTDRGPRPIHTREHPNGVPAKDLTPREVKEQQRASILLERTAEIAIAARLSPRKTTIIFENPADRSIPGTVQFSPDKSNHGSIFQTATFQRLEAAIGPCSSCTFAQCRFGAPHQKYTTFVYTNDAAAVLDPLNGASFKCNHTTHAKIAGGRSSSGDGWQSVGSEQYPDQLNVRIASALTSARTGDHRPMDMEGEPHDQPHLADATPPPDALPPPLPSTRLATAAPLSAAASPFAPTAPIAPSPSAQPRVASSPAHPAPPTTPSAASVSPADLGPNLRTLRATTGAATERANALGSAGPRAPPGRCGRGTVSTAFTVPGPFSTALA
jgi:hypothetical protein